MPRTQPVVNCCENTWRWVSRCVGGRGLMVGGFCGLVMILGQVGCQRAEPTGTAASVGTGEQATSVDESNPASKSDVGAIVVPDGTPEELFEFLTDVEERELTVKPTEGDGESGEEPDQTDAVRRVMNTRITVCDKILAKSITEEVRVRAVRIKLDALRTLAGLDPAAMNAPFQEFAQRMIESGNPLLARLARATQFQSRVYEFVSLQRETPEQILEWLDQLLAEPNAGPELLEPCQDAVSWIIQSGKMDVAAKALDHLGQHFAKHENESVSAAGRSMLQEAIELRLSEQTRQIAKGEEGSVDRFIASIDELLQGDLQDKNLLGYATQSAQFLEFDGHLDAAKRAYSMILARYKDHPDTTVAATVQRTVDLANRRLSLVGQPSVVFEGVTLDGNTFDWRAFQGKWVLVEFWTTWQNDIVGEFNRIRDAVRPYADSSLEVVMINLDDDRNILEKFLKQNPTAYKIVVQADPNASAFESANAKRCGVEAVPFSMLIDPLGEVTHIHLMGDRLKNALVEKLGAGQLPNAPTP